MSGLPGSDDEFVTNFRFDFQSKCIIYRLESEEPVHAVVASDEKEAKGEDGGDEEKRHQKKKKRKKPKRIITRYKLRGVTVALPPFWTTYNYEECRAQVQ